MILRLLLLRRSLMASSACRSFAIRASFLALMVFPGRGGPLLTLYDHHVPHGTCSGHLITRLAVLPWRSSGARPTIADVRVSSAAVVHPRAVPS